MPLKLPVEFHTEVVSREDGTTYERDVIETTQPDGTKSARLATMKDREEYPDDYAVFVNAEVIPTYDELLAEWREKHPKPTAAQTAALIVKRDAGEKADAPDENPRTTATMTAPVRSPVAAPSVMPAEPIPNVLVAGPTKSDPKKPA